MRRIPPNLHHVLKLTEACTSLSAILLSHFLLNLRKTAIDPHASGTRSSSVISELRFTNVLGDLGSIRVGYSSSPGEEQHHENEESEGGEYIDYELEERHDCTDTPST